MVKVVFQDGEPVDPYKLQKLQDQIEAIDQKAQSAFDLSNSTADNLNEVFVFHAKAGVEIFENGFTAGQQKEQQINVEWSADYEAVYTVATPRLKNPSKYDIRVSFTGDSKQPMMVVWSKEKFENSLYVHWISVAKKRVTIS